MGIILWIIFGALIGYSASLIMKTDPNQGIFTTIFIGILGAVLGGWIMSFLGNVSITEFNIYSFLVSLLGAIILIALFRTLRRIA